MVSHSEVAQCWARGESVRGSRMFTDGVTVYSYGTHWPIATKINDGRQILFNTSKNSPSTSRHTSYVDRALPAWAEIINCDETQIKDVVNGSRNLDKIKVIEKTYYPTNFTELMEAIEHCFRVNKVKRFNRKKITEFLRNEFVAQRI